jgi:ferritin-like metal-binding protein YciE
MQGLVAESEEYMQDEEMDPEIRDNALVGSEQKAEHYEIAAYNSAIEMAELMGHKHAARVLRQILTEEERMSRKLEQISTRWLKKRYREEQRAEREAEAA